MGKHGGAAAVIGVCRRPHLCEVVLYQAARPVSDAWVPAIAARAISTAHTPDAVGPPRILSCMGGGEGPSKRRDQHVSMWSALGRLVLLHFDRLGSPMLRFVTSSLDPVLSSSDSDLRGQSKRVQVCHRRCALPLLLCSSAGARWRHAAKRHSMLQWHCNCDLRRPPPAPSPIQA